MSYRTIFLSDIHLGTRGCQAELLLDFLSVHDAETIYLVGDIFDGWKLRRGWHWPQSHNDVIAAFLDKARGGTRVIFIPGNHDEVARDYYGTHFGGIEVVPRAEFVSADNRRFLVTHGDEFDSVVVNARWLALLGDRAYQLLLWLNPKINAIRRIWNGRYWSLSKWAKGKVKQAVNFIGEYEKVLSNDAKRGGYDGVICGHIHHADMKQMGDILYVNTGDWVESCTAILEDQDGKLSLVDWEARIARRKAALRRAKRKKTSKPRNVA